MKINAITNRFAAGWKPAAYTLKNPLKAGLPKNRRRMYPTPLMASDGRVED
jgi:hypothetical protein